jgi:radical SAM superfamily enzyme YgiQ (UPF0313 family)
MKKIVFLYSYYTEKIRIQERTEFPPLGTLSIAAIFEQMGFDVEVFPIHKDFELNDLPNAFIYAYSITASVTYPLFVDIVPKLKNKANIHIAGNTHCSTFPNEVLEELNLDAVFTGESEVIIQQWIKNGCTEKGIFKGQSIDINNYPFSARHLLAEQYIYLNKRLAGQQDNVISMISSRGCTFNCKFCAISNRGKLSFKKPEIFEAELKDILTKYPKCSGIVLLDETFSFNKKHAIDITSILHKYNMPYECNSRADTLSEKLIKHLVETNCKEVKIGIETGSQELSKNINKQIDLNKAKDIIKLANSYGLPIKIYLMHGFPFENLKTTDETITFLTELKPFLNRVALYRFVPLPGSPVYAMNFINKLSWDKYTIYDNNNCWWGCASDYQELNASYKRLKSFITENFNM